MFTDGFVGHVFDGVPVWQMLVHVVNHGTQHRADVGAGTTGILATSTRW